MATRSVEPYRDPTLPERFLRWIEVLRQRIKTIPCYFQGAGSPEGVISANTGDRYYDETANQLYIKSTDGGNTGWLVVGGNGGAAGVSGRQFALTSKYSDSLDTAIQFESASYDNTNNRILVGGNNSFVGLIADADIHATTKIKEAATLPSSVVANGNISDIVENPNGGIFVRSGNNILRAPVSGTPWTDLTTGPLVALSKHSIIGWKTNQLVVSHFKLSTPNRDYAVSSDNGVTWSLHSSGITTTGGGQLRKSKDGSKLGTCVANQQFSWTTSVDLTAASWNFVNLFTAIGFPSQNITDCAFNTDGSVIVIVGANSDIAYSINGGSSYVLVSQADNPFRNASVEVLGEVRPIHNSTLGGFVLIGRTQAVFYSDADFPNPTGIIPVTSHDGGSLSGANVSGTVTDPDSDTVALFGDANELLLLTPWA